jgi:hypothetical protein
MTSQLDIVIRAIQKHAFLIVPALMISSPFHDVTNPRHTIVGIINIFCQTCRRAVTGNHALCVGSLTRASNHVLCNRTDDVTSAAQWTIVVHSLTHAHFCTVIVGTRTLHWCLQAHNPMHYATGQVFGRTECICTVHGTRCQSDQARCAFSGRNCLKQTCV